VVKRGGSIELFEVYIILSHFTQIFNDSKADGARFVCWFIHEKIELIGLSIPSLNFKIR
jgi:hypothetical protein